MQGQRAWRSVLAIGGLMALLALVAVAAAGHAPSAGASRPSAPAPKLLQDYVATLALLIMPIGVVLIVWAVVMSRVYKDVPLKTSKAVPDRRRPAALHPGRDHPRRDRARTPLRRSRRRPREKIAAGGDRPRQGEGDRPTRGSEYEPQFRWLPMIVVGSLDRRHRRRDGDLGRAPAA